MVAKRVLLHFSIWFLVPERFSKNFDDFYGRCQKDSLSLIDQGFFVMINFTGTYVGSSQVGGDFEIVELDQ